MREQDDEMEEGLRGRGWKELLLLYEPIWG